MKKTALLGSLCLILTTSLFSCKKDAVTPEANTPAADMALKATTSITNAAVTDDTQSLQSQLNAGNVTLTAGKTYNVTGLTVTHALNMNGATINLTRTSYAYAITMKGTGASVTNGTLQGQWSSSQAGSSSGYGGVYILANNCSVSHVNVSNFSACGIVVGPVNSSSVTYCNISNTGYVGYFYDSETASTSVGTFSYNTIDRSMVPASTIQQMAVAIRGSANNPSIVTTGWAITNNTIKMPVNPAGSPAEGMEIRYCKSANVANNVITAGSIGISVVACSGLTVQNNTIGASKMEGIEFAQCTNSKTNNNTISSSYGVGILLDGGIGCNGIQLNADKVSGTQAECIHAYKGTQNLTISGCSLSSATSGTYSINLQSASAVNIQNNVLTGNGLGSTGVELDNCTGNVTMTGGSVSNFKSSVISIYNCTSGLVTDNVSMSGVTVTGTPKGLVSVLANGGLLGINISVVL